MASLASFLAEQRDSCRLMALKTEWTDGRLFLGSTNNEWSMHEWMSEWVNEWMNQSFNGSLNRSSDPSTKKNQAFIDQWRTRRWPQELDRLPIHPRKSKLGGSLTSLKARLLKRFSKESKLARGISFSSCKIGNDLAGWRRLALAVLTAGFRRDSSLSPIHSFIDSLIHSLFTVGETASARNK